MTKMARRKKDNTLLYVGLGLLAYTLMKRPKPVTGTPNTLPPQNNNSGNFWDNLPDILGGAADVIEATGSQTGGGGGGSSSANTQIVGESNGEWV